MNETDSSQSRSEKEILFKALGMNSKGRKTGINNYEI
jgi:hypothetical protein